MLTIQHVGRCAAETNERIDALEQEFKVLASSVALHHLKQCVDSWIIKYDRWLTKIAVKAAKSYGLFDIWEDLKSELILQAYAAVDRYDVSRGVPLGTYLISTLWHYALRDDVIGRYKRHKLETISLQQYVDVGNDDYSAPVAVEDKREVSSLERAAVVNSLVAKLDEYDRLVIYLRFDMGMQPKQIDEMLGASRGTTWHKVETIIMKLRTVAVA